MDVRLVREVVPCRAHLLAPVGVILSARVLGWGHGLEMAGIRTASMGAALPVAAALPCCHGEGVAVMVDLHPGWDRPSVHLVGEPMDLLLA
jgi:hypothetical protein